MCKGSNTTTTTQGSTNTSTPNPVALQAYNNAINRAAQTAQLPFNPYSQQGEMVAPINYEQMAGITNINQNALGAQPEINKAEGLISGAAQPLTAGQIQNYYDPFQQQVINATEQQFNLQNAQQQNQLTGNAAAQGALGGNRLGVAQAQLAGQQQINEAPVIAGLEQQGYNAAFQAAAQQYQQNPMAAAYGLGQLGVAGQNAALQGAGAQVQAGTLQQQTQQASDTAYQNQFMEEQAFPYQQLSWEAGLDTGVGSLMGGTNVGTGYGVTQGPTPSSLNTVGGLGLAALGLFAKDGGRVPEYDAGGAAPGVGLMPYGGGSGLYGGSDGYIPTLQLTHGQGPPQNTFKIQTPSAAGQQTPSVQQMTQQAKGIGSAFKGAQNLFGSGSDWAGGPDVSDDFSAGFGDARGGRIPHFDTGGGADDTDALPFTAPSSGWGVGSFPSSDSFVPPSTDRPIQVASLAPPASDAGGVSPEHSTSPSMDEKRGVTVAMNGNAVPNGVLQDAAYLVKQGASSQDLQSFMSRNGYPMDGNWCGEFAASVVHAAGGQPPPGAAVATNWMKYGRGVSPQDVHPGDVAVLTRGHGVGETGGHVGFVSEVDPQHGRFSLLGGNQGQAVKNEPLAGFQFRRGDYSDTPEGVASTNTVDPSGHGEAQSRGLLHFAQAATGASSDGGGFLGLHLSDAARQGLIGAGFGMMASKSPFPGVALGEGGLQGLQAYSNAKTRDLAVQRLGIEAEKARALIAKEHAETEAVPQRLNIDRQNVQGNLALRQAEIAKMGRQVTPAGILDLNTSTLTRWDGTTMKVGPSSGVPSSASPSPVTGAPLPAPGPAQTAIAPPTAVPGTPTGTVPRGPQGAPTPQPSSPAHASIMDDPKLSTAIQLPDQMPFDSRMMTAEGAKIPIQEAEEKTKKATDANDAAQNMKYRLDEFEHAYGNLPDSGWMAPGKGLEERQTVAAAANTLTRMLGQGNVIDPQQLASSEELKKLSTTMGFDLARTLGSREAQMIVRQAVGSVPSGELSPQGARRLVAGLRAAAQRQEDYYSGLQAWSARNNGSILGYDDWFNRTHSPEKYAMRAQAEIVDKQAQRAGKTGADVVTVLRQHPDAASKFDARYGTPGLGAYLLSQ